METVAYESAYQLEKSSAREWKLILSGKFQGASILWNELDAECEKFLKGNGKRTLTIVFRENSHWDTSLVAFFYRLQQLADEYHQDLKMQRAPRGLQALLEVAQKSKKPIKAPSEKISWKSQFLERFRDIIQQTKGGISFIGQVVQSISRALQGKVYARKEDYILLLKQVGIDALPIVSLISFLVGVILGFIGVVQLARFGAAIYVADLVGIAMAREMGAIMTGVIMAGRTGAAFAATIGTMKVNEELDALETFGISPIDFLVFPRILAMAIMMPLLTVFSIFIGIAGGMMIALPLFDFTLLQYINETVNSVSLINFFLGVFKGFVFGLLIAGLGCLRGLQCQRSASEVGRVTTSAVVSGITAIIIADALFAFLFNALNI